MELLTCTQCGAEIEGEGIRYRRRLFCSDECCETFEEGFLNHGGPDAEDLEAEAEELFDEDDLLADDEDENEVGNDVDLDDDLGVVLGAVLDDEDDDRY